MQHDVPVSESTRSRLQEEGTVLPVALGSVVLRVLRLGGLGVHPLNRFTELRNTSSPPETERGSTRSDHGGIHCQFAYDTVSHDWLKGSLWSHVPSAQCPRRGFDAVMNVYGSASAFSKWTNHSACWCVTSTEGTIFGRRTSGPCGGRKEGTQGRKGSVTPLGRVNVGP